MTRAIKSKETVIEEEVKVEPVVTTTRKRPTRKARPKIDKNEPIACTSVVEGAVVYVSRKTGLRVIWQNYGDMEYIDFEELLTMKASTSAFLTEPYIIVENDDVMEYFGLTNLYSKLFEIDIDDLDGFFQLSPSVIEGKIKNLPKGYRETIAMKARRMVEDGTLYDTRVMKILATELGMDFSLIGK